jgi:hypothetical protein
MSITLYLAGFVAISAFGSESNVITLGDNEKAGEVLVLSESQLVKLTADQKSVPGLVKLAEESDSPIVYFDDAGNSGGALGFIGSNKIAFVTNLTIQAVMALSNEEATAIIENAKPISYSEFMQIYNKNPPIPYPTVPIEITPSMRSLLLKDKPSNVVLCKSADKFFAVEFVGQSTDTVSVQLIVHQKE